MEYKENPNMSDEQFSEIENSEEYMSVDNCCGGEEHMVCIVTAKNDDKNALHSDVLIT